MMKIGVAFTCIFMTLQTNYFSFHRGVKKWIRGILISFWDLQHQPLRAKTKSKAQKASTC